MQAPKGRRQQKDIVRFVGRAPDQIFALVGDPDIQLRPVDLVAALFHVSKSPPRAVDTSRLNDLLEQLNQHAGQLKARELSNVFLACRRLKVIDHRTWTTMCNQARQCVTDFNSQVLLVGTRNSSVAMRTLASTLYVHLCNVRSHTAWPL